MTLKGLTGSADRPDLGVQFDLRNLIEEKMETRGEEMEEGKLQPTSRALCIMTGFTPEFRCTICLGVLVSCGVNMRTYHGGDYLQRLKLPKPQFLDAY